MVCNLWLAGVVSAQTTYENYTWVTLAGPDTPGAGSVDAQGGAARFNGPTSIARDASGNFYVADYLNSTIRKIAPDGTTTTLAGLAGFAGTNDGAGAAARFNGPFGIAVDSSGNVYVSDNLDDTIRKISPAGLVTTFAGAPGVSGSADGTNSAARFNLPDGLALDSNNNLYVADTDNHTIRKITPGGVVSTFAGLAGNSGTNNGTGNHARFAAPFGIALDAGGNVYVSDRDNDDIRLISPAGAVSTLAGAPGVQGGSDGTNGTAHFFGPENLTVDSNTNIYVTDSFNNTIRKVTTAGVVTTLLGVAGDQGNTDATGTNAFFHTPVGIAIDNNTNLFISDYENDAIREASAALVVTTFAGLPVRFGTNDATGTAARFQNPAGTAVDTNGNVYVTDESNDDIRKITPAGSVSTYAGKAGITGTNDGPALSSALFNSPLGLALDASGNVIVADSFNNTIREISSLGVVSTIAGTPGVSGPTNGNGSADLFNQPFSVAVDSNENIFVGDTHNHAIREIMPGGVITTFAGSIGNFGTNDGVGTNAEFTFPEGVALDASGDLYVVDDGNATIRKITPDAAVSTLAGTPGVTGSADGPGTNATFSFPFGDAVDANGNIYVADANNELIRKITPAGNVTTLGGVPGQAGSQDGTAGDARFNAPEGLSVDSQGNVYVADAINQSIRKGYPAIPDVPVVDLIGAHTNVTRHLSISNQTTTDWSWTLIRQPANSSAQIIGTNTANPTITPDLEDIYVIQFRGQDSSGRTAIQNLTLYADNTPPTVAITNPAAGVVVSNGLFGVAGTTTDNLGVSSVFVQLNGGAWTNATGTTNWTVDENLVGGTNAVRAYSQDFAGNVSQTNEVDFRYIISDRLKAVVKGGGTLKPDLNGVFLQIGQTYSMTVKPVSGSTFSNWTANLIAGTNSETITFVMQSNLSLTANCIDHEKPTVAITFPKPAKFYSVSNLTVAGIAKDNDAVASVSYQLNGGPWTNATGTTNWFANLKLNSGANTLLVYAEDPSGNHSTTNHVTLTYLPTAIAGGNYAGLFFDTNNLTATNAGFFSAAVTPTAGFTAKILLGGSSISFTGQFSQDGVFSNSFVPKGFNTPFTVQLTLDLTGAGTITGTIANSGWSAPLLANQDVFSTANPPSQNYQRFSLAIPGGEDSTNQPGGNSVGTIILDGVGDVTFTGTLADGSPASQKTFISKNGEWPFFISSSSGNGVTLGWLTFSPGQEGTLTGQVYWERLPQANASLYPAGFNFANGITVAGSFYDFYKSVPVLVLPNSEGQAVLQQAGFSPALTNHFTLLNHGLKDVVAGSNKLNLTITLFTGAFKGSVVDPDNNLSIPVSGVVLTNQNAGFGFFITSNQSGSIFIGTNSP